MKHELMEQISEYLLRFSSDYAPSPQELAKYRREARGLYAEILERATALSNTEPQP